MDLINLAYDSLTDSVYEALAKQTRLAAYMDAIDSMSRPCKTSWIGTTCLISALALATALAATPAMAQRAAAPIATAAPQSAGVSPQRLERLTAVFTGRKSTRNACPAW